MNAAANSGKATVEPMNEKSYQFKMWLNVIYDLAKLALKISPLQETRSPVTPNSSLLQRFLSRVNLKPGAEESITWGSKFLITAEDPVICGPSSLTAAEDQVTGNPKFLAAREDLVSGGSAFLIDSEGVVPVTE
ncbi:hypothetical protein ROHU_004283 [Labeo rohita]|uniref:Uncharacterized protein n=1 Tax=Labeo rohita TaxID=84645 RepID=A0A498NP87_LABRO|nr:hypothetical protein ROHU_004283 [Labeo rohita]